MVGGYIVQLRTCQALGEIRSLKHKLQPAGAKMVSDLQVVISILNAIWCFTVNRALLALDRKSVV